jgi:hypothetical protein
MNTSRMPDDDEALARELQDLAAGLDFPPTPDLVTPVGAALASDHSPGLGRWWALGGRQVRLSLVLASLGLVLAVGVVAATALFLGGLRITFVDHLPTVAPATVPHGELGSNLGLGAMEELASAERHVSFELFVPTTPALATPDAVYYNDLLAGGQVSLVYAPGNGRPPPTETGVSVLITEFPGTLEEDLAQKSVGPGTTVEILSVSGGLAFWIEGRPHVITYRDSTGNYGTDFMRLVHNSLVWEQDGTVLRIEGGLSRGEALALAASFVRAP